MPGQRPRVVGCLEYANFVVGARYQPRYQQCYGTTDDTGYMGTAPFQSRRALPIPQRKRSGANSWRFQYVHPASHFMARMSHIRTCVCVRLCVCVYICVHASICARGGVAMCVRVAPVRQVQGLLYPLYDDSSREDGIQLVVGVGGARLMVLQVIQ